MRRPDPNAPRNHARRHLPAPEALESRALLAVVVSTFTPTEGALYNGPVATFDGTDVSGTQADFAATIDWGVGAPAPGVIQSLGNNRFEVRGFTTYPENGQYTARVTVTGANATQAQGRGPVTVTATVPTVEARAQVARAGVPFQGIVAEIRDANPLEDAANYTATITWEDGATTAGTVAPDANGGFTVNGSYTYGAAGAKSAVVRVYERGIVTPVTVATSITVQAAPPVLVATGTTIDVVAGDPFAGAVATFTDGTNGAPPSDYRAKIDWGDGTPATQGAVALAPDGSRYVVTGATTYGKAGTFPITVTVTRVADGAEAKAPSQARVVAAIFGATGATVAAVAGRPFEGVVATFADSTTPSLTTDYKATIAWGDGTTTDGAIVRAGAGYAVRGAVTYAKAGTYPVTVTITRNVDNAMVQAASQALVQAAAFQVTGTTIHALTGRRFDLPVAAFTDAANPNGRPSDYRAKIDWGDGTPPAQGEVVANGTNSYVVRGATTYAKAGTYAINVTVTRVADGAEAKAPSQAQVAAATAFVVAGVLVEPRVGRPFEGVVATFTDGTTPSLTTDYKATIAWGDGTTTDGAIVRAGAGYAVRGAVTYAKAGTYPVTVTITRNVDNAMVQAASRAIVTPVTFAARIDPASDTGPSNTDGITSVSSPIVAGTATPFAIIQLYARRAGGATPVPVGQSVADARGVWRTRIGPLADGVYTLLGTEAPAGAPPGPVTEFLQAITIDTVAPRVVQLAYIPRLNRVTVVYRDNLSGVVATEAKPEEPAKGALDPKNYVLIGPPLRRVPSLRPARYAARQGPAASDPLAVDVTPPAAMPPTWPRTLRINAAGVTDRAGNRLDGDGDGQPGGDFSASLAGHRRTVRLPGTDPDPAARPRRRSR